MSRGLVVIMAAALLPGLALLHAIWSSIGADGISGVTRKLTVVDFANLWSGGMLARHGQLTTLFDAEAYRAWLRATFSPRYESSEWSYPPAMLLPGALLSFLGVYPAYIVWLAATAGLLFMVLRRCGIGRVPALAALMSPAMLQNVIFGQNGALTAALLAGALMLRRSGLVGAGVCAGMFILKPQFGLLLPIVFIASRNIGASIVAAITAVLLALITAVAFGANAWLLFWTQTRPLMVSVLEARWPSGHMVNGVTVFFMVRALGASLATAYAVQGVSTLLAIVAAVVAWRRPCSDPALLFAFTVPLIFLATPYGYNYDLVALAAAAAIVMAAQGWRFHPVTLLTWVWPGLSSLLGAEGWLISPIVLVAFALTAWHELNRAQTTQVV